MPISCIVQLPFDMYYTGKKKCSENDDKYFGCDAVIQKIQHSQSGALVCLVRVSVSRRNPVAPKRKKQNGCDVEGVFLLLSSENNALLDMYIPDSLLYTCTVDSAGQYIVRVLATEA